jgi:RNA polymerase sigma factor FliA
VTEPPVEPAPDQLIEEYHGLAASLAVQVWRTAPHALDVDELRAIANLGLVHAAKRWQLYCVENGFDPWRLEYFKPFVVRRVRGACFDAIRQSDWATRSLRTRMKALQDAGLDRGATHAELAARTGLSVADVRATLRGMAQRPVSMQAEEIDPMAETDVESTVVTRSLLAAMVAVIASLPPEQATVLALHYHRNLQLQEIAAALGVPEAHVSELHAAAVLAVHTALQNAAKGVT